MLNKKIAIIGCGNLGESILIGLLEDDKYPSENISITKRNLKPIEKYKSQGVYVTSDNNEAVKRSDIIILALKPYNIFPIIQQIDTDLNPAKHVIVSLASSVSIGDMQNATTKQLPIYRAMPNTAANVKESITCICSDGNDTHIPDITTLFDKIGSSIVIDEKLMESATILGACGIAYAMRFIRAMVQGGIQIGFDSATANAIAYQTVKGAAELLIKRGNHPEYEIDKVTTPKGCTIVGLNEMEHNGFSSALIKGIVTSFEKI